MAADLPELTEQARAAAAAIGLTNEEYAKLADAQDKAAKKSAANAAIFAQTAEGQRKIAEGQQKIAENAAAELKLLGDAAQRQADKAQDIFHKGVGGEQLAGHLRDVREGYRLAADKELDFETRLTAGTGVLGIAAGAALDFGRALNDVMLAAEAEREQINLLSAAHSEMRRETQDTISLSNESALREQALAHGLELTAADYGVAARAAREYAAIHGGDMSAAIQHVIGDLQGQAGATGSVLTQTERTSAALARMREEQQHLGPLVRSRAEDQQAWTARLHDFGQEVIAAMAATESMSEIDHRIMAGETADHTQQIAQHEAERLAHERTAQAQEAARASAQRLKQEHIELAAGMDQVKTAAAMLQSAMNMDVGTADRFAARLAAARAAVEQGVARRAEDRAVRRALTAYHGTARTDAMAGGGVQAGGGPGFTGDQRDEMNRQITAIEVQMHDQSIRFERMHGKVHETVQHFLQREQAEMRRAMELRQRMLAELDMGMAAVAAHGTEADRVAAREAQNADVEDLAGGKSGAWRTRKTEYDAEKTQIAAVALERKTALDAEQDAHDWRLQSSRAWRDTLHTDQSAVQSFTEFSTAAFNNVTGSFKAHLSALIVGKETIGEALSGMLQETLLSVATEAAVQALFEGAKAIAAAASDRYDQAAEHAYAAAAYAATAIATGVGAGVMARSSAAAPNGSGAASPRPANAASVPGGSNAGGGGGMTVVYNISGVFDQKGADGVVHSSLQNLYRNGNLPPVVRTLTRVRT
jgi:hypothetical protein